MVARGASCDLLDMASTARLQVTDTVRAWRALNAAAFALYGLLAANIAVAAVAMAVTLDQRSLLVQYRNRPSSVTVGDVDALQHRVDSINGIGTWLIVATAVGFATWATWAYARLGRRQPERYLGLGWAIAAWFVPIVNLFLPKRIVGELVHGATAGPDDLPTVVRLNRWTAAWWTSWLLTLAAGVIAHLASNSADTADRALGATWTYLVRDVLLVVAALLAIRCVQLLTARSRSLFTDS